MRGIATAVAPTGAPDGLTPVQRAVMNALAESMTGIAVDAADGEPLPPDAFGFFEYDRGHISGDPERMAARLADAMYRGAKTAWNLDDNGRSDETDLLETDWFAYADWPIDEVRAHLGLLPKSLHALEAGSVSPWEAGGMSPFQYTYGRRLAADEGRQFDSYGAAPPRAAPPEA